MYLLKAYISMSQHQAERSLPLIFANIPVLEFVASRLIYWNLARNLDMAKISWTFHLNSVILIND